MAAPRRFFGDLDVDELLDNDGSELDSDSDPGIEIDDEWYFHHIIQV